MSGRLGAWRLLRAALLWLGRCDERRRQRRALATLDDHLLRDIGVSRREAQVEADRWFWR